MRKNKVFPWLAILFGTSILCASCSMKEVKSTQTISVATEVEEYSYRTSYASIGNVISSKTIYLNNNTLISKDIVCKKAGKIDDIYFKKGDKVKKGDLLLLMDSSALLKELENIERKKSDLEQEHTYIIEQKKMEQELVEEKLRDGIVSQYEKESLYEGIDAKYQADLSYLQEEIDRCIQKLELLKEQIQDCKIYAKEDSLITKINQNLYVEEGDILMVLSDATSGTFTTDDMTYQDYFQKEDMYELKTYSGENYQTKYLGVDKETDTMRFSYVGTVDLPVGLQVMYEMVLDQKENVLCIDNTYLHHEGETPFVYVLDEVGLKDIRYISIGLVGNKTTEVTDGLTDGELIAK